MLKPGYEPSEATRQMLMDYCRKHIARYAMPYDIEFRSDLPKTLVGKVAYRVLEEEMEKAAPAGRRGAAPVARDPVDPARAGLRQTDTCCDGGALPPSRPERRPFP